MHNNNLSISGKFGAFFASIPLPIFAAAYCVLYAIVGECSLFAISYHTSFV